jgi:hypothetical protein
VQEFVNAVRTLADVQRFFPVTQSSAVVMRGTNQQAEICQWLTGSLDVPGPVAAAEYVAPATSPGVFRLLPLQGYSTPEALQSAVARIRTEAQAYRVFGLPDRAVIAVRGTPAQTAIASRIAGELDTLARQ